MRDLFSESTARQLKVSRLFRVFPLWKCPRRSDRDKDYPDNDAQRRGDRDIMIPVKSILQATKQRITASPGRRYWKRCTTSARTK